MSIYTCVHVYQLGSLPQVHNDYATILFTYPLTAIYWETWGIFIFQKVPFRFIKFPSPLKRCALQYPIFQPVMHLSKESCSDIISTVPRKQTVDKPVGIMRHPFLPGVINRTHCSFSPALWIPWIRIFDVKFLQLCTLIFKPEAREVLTATFQLLFSLLSLITLL